MTRLASMKRTIVLLLFGGSLLLSAGCLTDNFYSGLWSSILSDAALTVTNGIVTNALQ